MKRLLGMIKNISLRLLTSYRRFPEPLLFAFAVVATLIITNHNSNYFVEDSMRIALTFALGVPLTLCFRAFAERKPLAKGLVFAVYLATAAFLLLYYHFLLPDLQMVSMTRFTAINLAIYLLSLTIPYIGHKNGFESFVIKLFTGFMITFFYALVLFLGMAAILATINILFSAEISSKVYYDLWLIVAGIFAPAYFLAGVPAYGVEDTEPEYPKFLQILLLYIVLPLLTVYTAILYAYFIKIIVTRFWPAGIVSHLVLWYSLISTVVIFFIYLLKEDNAWANIFIKYLPKLILPLLLMMFVAMGIRINAYGVTENRYLVMVGGLWTTGSMLYYAVKKNTANIRIVLAASLITLLTVIGPWSSYAVSKYSQNNEMEALLTKNQMLVNGAITPSTTVSPADQNRMISIIEYFNQRHSITDIKVLPANFTLNQMKQTFGFDLSYSNPITDYFTHYPTERQRVLDIQGYDYYFSSSFGIEKEAYTSESISVSYDGQILRIAEGKQIIYEKDLTQIALDIHAVSLGQEMIDKETMIFADNNDQLAIKIIFHNINGMLDAVTGNPMIEWLEFSVLFRVN